MFLIFGIAICHPFVVIHIIREAPYAFAPIHAALISPVAAPYDKRAYHNAAVLAIDAYPALSVAVSFSHAIVFPMYASYAIL